MKINTKKIKIQDVKDGDLIKSYNVNSGEVVFNEVKKTHIKKVDVGNQLKFQLANGNSIITSKLTRLYLPKFNQYMNSEDFELGDELLTSDGKTTTKIVEISEFNSDNDFYDFTVENDENFFINSILTHNCGTRSGAITVSLDIFHKDIESFIEMKTESGGDVRQKCYNIFPQVIVNSKFIEAVRNDKEFPLVDRKTILDDLGIDVCDLKQFNDNYDLIVSKIKDKKLYNCELTSAKELWKKLLRIYIETGDLYIVCKDAMNKTNPFYDAEMFVNSYNLCLSGDTVLKIKDIQGDEKEVLLIELEGIENYEVLSRNIETGKDEWKKGYDFIKSEHDEYYEIEDEESGKIIKCSGNHKIWTENRGYVMAKDLVETDVLRIK